MRAEIDPGHDALTQRIIGAAFLVARTLGHGFLEVVYKNALSLQLIAEGLVVAKEKVFLVRYRGEPVGRYVADIVVNDTVVVELKVVKVLSGEHTAQVLNYLKASRLPVGLLFNFGRPRIEVRRILL